MLIGTLHTRTATLSFGGGPRSDRTERSTPSASDIIPATLIRCAEQRRGLSRRWCPESCPANACVHRSGAQPLTPKSPSCPSRHGYARSPYDCVSSPVDDRRARAVRPYAVRRAAAPSRLLGGRYRLVRGQDGDELAPETRGAGRECHHTHCSANVQGSAPILVRRFLRDDNSKVTN